MIKGMLYTVATPIGNTDRKSLLALRGVGPESEAASVMVVPRAERDTLWLDLEAVLLEQVTPGGLAHWLASS
jgi:hypothetical protein